MRLKRFHLYWLVGDFMDTIYLDDVPLKTEAETFRWHDAFFIILLNNYYK